MTNAEKTCGNRAKSIDIARFIQATSSLWQKRELKYPFYRDYEVDFWTKKQ